MAGSLHGDVASAIGQQVEQMILQAKKDSEARIHHELSVARKQLQHMENCVGELGERVGRCVQSNRPGAPDQSETVDRVLLHSKIAQLEQKWGSEVKALKQDLHRTILAHNHNSDLMRHHRDALDDARRKVDAMSAPASEQVDVQIDKVERIFRASQAKQRALDAMTERLGQLEQQVNEMLPSASMPSFPGMVPGMPGMMGPPAGLLGGQPGREAAPPPKKKEAGKAAEPATDEEIARRLMQRAGGTPANGASDEGSGFRAEAPVFIPRGAASAEGAAEVGDTQEQGAAGGGDAAKVTSAPAVAAGMAAAMAAMPPGLEAPAAVEAAEERAGAAEEFLDDEDEDDDGSDDEEDEEEGEAEDDKNQEKDEGAAQS